MRIILLESDPEFEDDMPLMYILITRTEDFEYMSSEDGYWQITPPKEYQVEIKTEQLLVDLWDGKEWWEDESGEFVRANIVFECTTQEEYDEWAKNHPEYFV